MLNDKKMKAAIFDMDGTLIDSMGEWRKLNCTFITDQGIALTPQQEKDLYSMTGRMVVEYVRDRFGITTDFATLVERASSRMETPYRVGVPLKPGAGEYLRRLGERGVKRVLCTATPSRLALIAANKSDIVKDLDYVYTTEALGGYKGDPAFFDMLCELIGEKKEDCVMFEDALYAMEGAKAAGLQVVGITDATNESDREAIFALCDQVIDSYDELE